MEKKIRNYVIVSYLVFWSMVMGLCGTASMVFHCSPFVMRSLSNVCAWSLALFREKIFPATGVLLIHFCFNFLYCFLQVDIIFYVVLSIIYLFIIAGCIAAERKLKKE